jgi:hypothetical protein
MTPLSVVVVVVDPSASAKIPAHPATPLAWKRDAWAPLTGSRDGVVVYVILNNENIQRKDIQRKESIESIQICKIKLNSIACG